MDHNRSSRRVTQHKIVFNQKTFISMMVVVVVGSTMIWNTQDMHDMNLFDEQERTHVSHRDGSLSVLHDRIFGKQGQCYRTAFPGEE